MSINYILNSLIDKFTLNKNTKGLKVDGINLICPSSE